MRKLLFVLASVVLLVLSCTAVAGAKYAGYMLDGAAYNSATSSKIPGYLSWKGAQTLMTKNNTAGDLAALGASSSLQAQVLGNPHGGYITTTTKCSVCHSAHRAVGATQADGVTPAVGTIQNQFLSMGDGSCVQCHTYWGASATAALKVEWANPADGGASGPHRSGGCTNPCHAAGVHGTASSEYWGMNAYMLGGINDQQITDELPLQEARATDTNQVATDSSLVAGIAWFKNGATVNTDIGRVPAGLSPVTYAGARSLLTGYTCSRTGCHVNSVFANLTWGEAYQREQKGAGTGFMATTGHSSAPGALNEAGPALGICGPCHPGAPAGGYRFDPGAGPVYPNSYNACAYGCDQCHDAVGALSNSTAFPHANRGIRIFEWDKTGAIQQLSTPDHLATSGNIWMYRGNQAQTGYNEATAVDKSFTLITDAVSVNGQLGNIQDGVCLKCHVPYDRISASVYGVDQLMPYYHVEEADSELRSFDPPSVSASQLNPYGGQESGPDANALNWIYLWR